MISVLMRFFFHLWYCYLQSVSFRLVSIHQVRFWNPNFWEFNNLICLLFIIFLKLCVTSFFDKSLKTTWTMRRGGKMFLLRGRSFHNPESSNCFGLHPDCFPRAIFMCLIQILFENYKLLTEKSEHALMCLMFSNLLCQFRRAWSRFVENEFVLFPVFKFLLKSAFWEGFQVVSLRKIKNYNVSKSFFLVLILLFF